MSKPAARITDQHTCPKVTPGTPPVPHIGGPVSSGCLTVFIEGQPAAREGDSCLCIGEQDIIMAGSSGVFIGGRPAARMGDQTAHGGKIVMGCVTVMIGEKKILRILKKISIIKQAISNSIVLLEKKLQLLERNDPNTLTAFKEWFGLDDDESRKVILERIRRILKVNKQLTIENFCDKAIDQRNKELFAEVYATDGSFTFYVNHLFWNAKGEGKGSRAGIIMHELSHFEDIGDTRDHVYGDGCLRLAKYFPNDALYNADSFEYFIMC